VTTTPLVLLVEPNPQDSTLAQTLGDDGRGVVCVRTIPEAMDRAKREHPAAIVCRGGLENALSLVRKLRCNAHTATLPAVVVADAADPVREELAKWGVKSVLGAASSDRQIAEAVREAVPLAPVPEAPDAEIRRPDRLRALERAHLLDTPPEKPYDCLARLTAQLLDVPIVLISVLDSQRQFFKAEVGLPSPVSTTRQLPVTHSFCQWVVTANDDLVVEDARRHLVLCTNNVAREAGIVAYAGVPLHADADETIGSFCAVDIKPRRWDSQELRALHDAADVARGLTAVRQAARLPPVTFEEFREMAGVAGRAIEAAIRLHEGGKVRVDAAEQLALLALAGDLGRQLARVSGRRT
jgi:DNA-binding NarL/FixJ family response regulator